VEPEECGRDSPTAERLLGVCGSVLSVAVALALFSIAVLVADDHPYVAVLCANYGVTFGGYAVVKRPRCSLGRRQWEQVGYAGAGVVAGVALLAGVRRDIVFLSVLLGLVAVVDWVLRGLGVLPLWDTE